MAGVGEIQPRLPSLEGNSFCNSSRLYFSPLLPFLRLPSVFLDHKTLLPIARVFLENRTGSRFTNFRRKFLSKKKKKEKEKLEPQFLKVRS